MNFLVVLLKYGSGTPTGAQAGPSQGSNCTTIGSGAHAAPQSEEGAGSTRAIMGSLITSSTSKIGFRLLSSPLKESRYAGEGEPI